MLLCRYEKLEKVGEGNYGTVYKALDRVSTHIHTRGHTDSFASGEHPAPNILGHGASCPGRG